MRAGTVSRSTLLQGQQSVVEFEQPRCALGPKHLLLRKDLDLALELFHAEESPVPLTALAREVVGLALGDFFDNDIAAIVRLYRRPRADPADH